MRPWSAGQTSSDYTTWPVTIGLPYMLSGNHCCELSSELYQMHAPFSNTVTSIDYNRYLHSTVNLHSLLRLVWIIEDNTPTIWTNDWNSKKATTWSLLLNNGIKENWQRKSTPFFLDYCENDVAYVCLLFSMSVMYAMAHKLLDPHLSGRLNEAGL